MDDDGRAWLTRQARVDFAKRSLVLPPLLDVSDILDRCCGVGDVQNCTRGPNAGEVRGESLACLSRG